MRPIGQLCHLVKERISLPLSCLGVGLISTWSELSFINPPLHYVAVPEAVFQIFNMSTVALAAVVAICLRLGIIHRALVARNRNLAITLILLLATTCLNFSAAVFGVEVQWLCMFAAVLGGLGLALLFVMWFEVISHLSPVQLLFGYALAAMGRVVLIWLCNGMQPDRLFASLCAVVVAAVVMLKFARDAVAQGAVVIAKCSGAVPSNSSPMEGACAFPLKPLLVVLTGTMALSLALRIVGNAGGTNGNLGVLVSAAMVVAAVLAKGDSFEFRWLWQGSLAFMAIFVVVLACTGMRTPLFAAFLVCISYEFCLMLMYSILGNLVYRNFYNSTFLYSVEIAIALTAGTVGDVLYDAIEHSFPEHATVALAFACGALSLLFAVAAIHAFSKRNLDGPWGNIIRKPIAHDTDLLLERTRLGLRCHELAEEASLSAREEEVLLLLAQRKKPAAIAEQLVIEVSTVNTHKKHIYRKLDVHSVKELQARLGSVCD